MIRRLAVRLGSALSTVVVLSSCAVLSVDDVSGFGHGDRDGYKIVLEFDSVLNLPDRAKVQLDGVDVGVVTGITLQDDRVDVTARIASGTVVPADIHATLQQATVLGDVYVALDRPSTEPPARMLKDGDRVPLRQTTSPPQLEDTIARLSTFVSSGSIQRVQNTIVKLNRISPPAEEVRRLTARVVDDLNDLSENMDDVDRLMDGASRTAHMLNDQIPQLEYLFSPKGQRGAERAVFILNYIATLLPGLGSIYNGGFWLVPLLNSLADTVGAMQQAKWAFEDDLPAWRRLFTDFFLPLDKYPAINITSIVGPDGRELSGNVQEVLRMLGAVP